MSQVIKTSQITKSGGVLYASEADCCGCGACRFICPVGAIEMVRDGGGFRYPSIDAQVCIGCDRCVSVCTMRAARGLG